MNAPLWPVHRRHATDDAQPDGALTQRHVWEGRFGAMVIEVVDGVAYVNGDRVDPMPRPPARPDVPPSEGEAR